MKYYFSKFFGWFRNPEPRDAERRALMKALFAGSALSALPVKEIKSGLIAAGWSTSTIVKISRCGFYIYGKYPANERVQVFKLATPWDMSSSVCAQTIYFPKSMRGEK